MPVNGYRMYFEPPNTGEELSIEEIRAARYGYVKKELGVLEQISELKEKIMAQENKIMAQECQIKLLQSQMEEFKSRETKDSATNTENAIDQSAENHYQNNMPVKSSTSVINQQDMCKTPTAVGSNSQKDFGVKGNTSEFSIFKDPIKPANNTDFSIFKDPVKSGNNSEFSIFKDPIKSGNNTEWTVYKDPPKSNTSEFTIYKDPASIIDQAKRRSTAARLSYGPPQLATLVEDSRENKISSSSSSSQEPSTFKRPSELPISRSTDRKFGDNPAKKSNIDGLSQPKITLDQVDAANSKKRVPFAPRNDDLFDLSLHPVIQHRGSMNFRLSEGFTLMMPTNEDEYFPKLQSTPEKPLINL